MLEVDGLSVALGGRDVLHDVSLRVAAATTVALLGPSGCGKTTLLRAVAGLQPSRAGTIRLGGEDLAGVPPHRRDVGLMFQDYALFPHRDVAGNVEFGLRMRRAPASVRRARVGEVLEMVGLAGFERRSVSELSGGERQRVALARSLATEPRVLMLDEPLGSLDRTLRDQLVLDLRELFSTQALTVVYVTHDQSEALALADDVVVIDSGRVVQHAAPSEVWNQPASPFVARFLGFTNLLDVEVVGGVVVSAFGPIGTTERSDGAATALVRPTAIRLDAGGSTATVRSAAFGGDHTTVDLVTRGGVSLEARVRDAVPSPGSVVDFAVDPGGVQLFAGRTGPGDPDTPE
jgi:thiamine transport system ATP-binding protein